MPITTQHSALRCGDLLSNSLIFPSKAKQSNQTCPRLPPTPTTLPWLLSSLLLVHSPTWIQERSGCGCGLWVQSIFAQCQGADQKEGRSPPLQSYFFFSFPARPSWYHSVQPSLVPPPHRPISLSCELASQWNKRTNERKKKTKPKTKNQKRNEMKKKKKAHPSPNPNPLRIHILLRRPDPRRIELIDRLEKAKVAFDRIAQFPAFEPRPATVDDDDDVLEVAYDVLEPVPPEAGVDLLRPGSAVSAKWSIDRVFPIYANIVSD